MAKVVIFTKEIIRGLLIKNFMAGGKSIEDVEIWENDIVTDFPYLTTDKVESVTGRLSNVAFIANKAQKANQPFANNVSIGSITIDNSAEYSANSITIPAASILEYGASGPVDDLLVEPLVKIKLTCVLSDKSVQVLEIKEGDLFYGMHVYPANSKPVHADLTVAKFIYTISSNKFDITGFTLADASGNSWDVNISYIKSFGTRGLAFAEDMSIAEAIAAVESDDLVGGLVLPGGVVVSDTFGISGNAKINGPGICDSDIIDETESVFENIVTCGPGAEVSITGMVLSKDSLTFLNDPAEISFNSCKFLGLEGSSTKLYGIKGQGINHSENETKLVVENCYFGTNASNMYNLFELNTKLGDTVIRNNYFAYGSCNHNQINIYEVADGATITIEDNHFEHSANAVRVGTVGNPQNVTINMINNTYDTTDETDPDWAGLFFVQPYGTATQSMAGITINARGNVGPEGTQLYYIYCGGGDTQLDDSTKPVINVE